MPIPVFGGSFFAPQPARPAAIRKQLTSRKAPPTVVDSYAGHELSFGHGSEIHSLSM
jgi:hypothetical protein